MYKTRTMIRLFAMVSLLWSLGAVIAQSRGQRAEDITVSYSLDSYQFTLHEPLILNFVVKNGSDKSVQVNLGKNDTQNFLITITRPDGTKLRLPPLFAEGLGTTGLHSVAPGQEYKRHLVLNEWFEFGVEGHYEIAVRLTQPVKTAGGIPLTEVAPFDARLEILRRDATRLEEICSSLVEQLEAAPSYEAALEAALPLSFVQDPIAVPYLEKALNAGHLIENIAINGLRRIANPDAVEVLVSAIGRTHPQALPETAIMAEAALGMIADETHDAALKETIQRALQHTNEKKP